MIHEREMWLNDAWTWKQKYDEFYSMKYEHEHDYEKRD
jgi:hypothetical protein